MKNKFIIWSMIMSIVSLNGTELNIRVDNIDTKKGGNLSVYIFGKNGYPKVHKDALLHQIIKVEKNSENFIFEIENNIKDLSIKVHHDENSDGKVSKNWTGIYPKEGLGFSKKQEVVMFGPPNYEDSKLTLEEFREKINISLIYP